MTARAVTGLVRRGAPGSSDTRFDSRRIPGLGGLVGVATCPGALAGGPQHVARRCDLERDVDRFRAWGAVAVVTLIDELSMLAAGIGVLPAALQARGIEWHHLPARSGPGAARRGEGTWHVLRLRLRAHLAHGGNVLIHGGTDPAEASRLAGRLVDDLAPPAPGGISGEPASAVDAWRRHDRIAGCLLGGLLGNAIARAIRFRPLDDTPLVDAGGNLAPAVLKGGCLVLDAVTLKRLESLGVLGDGATAYAPARASPRDTIAVPYQEQDQLLAEALQGIGVVPTGCEGTEAMAALITEAIEGSGLDRAVAVVNVAVSAGILDTGSNAPGLKLALECVRSDTPFIEAMSLAASLEAGAAEAVCVVGGIVGAAVGLSGIPHDWASRLDPAEALTGLLQRF